MARKARGEGSVTQRRDGRWQASLQVDGVRRTVCGDTRADVVRKLAELKRQAGSGGLPDPGKRTVADLLTAWQEAAAPTLKPKTVDDYSRVSARHILPALGRVRLSKLEPAHIERMLASIQRGGHRRTAVLVYAILHRACTFGVRWRWLSENPLDRVQRPQHHARRKALWSPEQLRAFLAGARDHWLFPLWYILIASGCRLGELLALRWQDVDLEGGSITVTRTLQRVAGQVVEGEPKTASGARTVALPAEALQVLRQQRGRQVLAGMAADLVFANRKGRPLHHSTVEHALRRECARLGLPAMAPHGLRHLHASLLLDQGLPVPVVSARLGHATPAVTMAVYAHAIRRQGDAGAEAIARALRSE